MNPIIILARLIFPLTILKWPFFGGLVAIWLDNIDWHTKYFLGISPIGDYQEIDKVLDMYYLTLLALVTWWAFKDKIVRNILLGLFVWRFVGFVAFEITHVRSMLFFFPNIFENLFFLYLLIEKIAKLEPKYTIRAHAFLFALAAFPKMIQEYEAHIIDKPIEIHFWLLPPDLLQNTNVAVLYIILIAFWFGKWYKKHSKTP